MTHANRPTESPSRLSAKVNARHLEEVPERDLHTLADMLEDAADAYLNAAAAADPSIEIATPNGLVIDPPTMAALLLGEQLIHGLDISRAATAGWTIDTADALLVIPGVLSVAPQYLRPPRAAVRAVASSCGCAAVRATGWRSTTARAVVTGGGQEGRLRDHRGSGRVPVCSATAGSRSGRRAARPAPARRPKAMAGDEVRHIAGQPELARTVGSMTSVVIVGSGFTGFECARQLARKLRKHELLRSTSRSSRRSTTCSTRRCCPTWRADWSTRVSSRSRSPTRCAACARSAAGSTASTSTGTPSPTPIPRSGHAACRGTGWC